MKFALIFLISILVVHAHQYFHAQPRATTWLSPYPPHPFIDEYQPFVVYFSKPAGSPKIYSPEDLSGDLLQQDARLLYTGHPDSVREFQENYNAADSQPRVKASLEEVKPRFLFGLQQATLTNPFFKTATFTVSSTITVSSLVRCIPAAKFPNVAAQKTPCRRKRSSLELRETPESQFIIAPSERLLTAASLPPVGRMQEHRSQLADLQLSDRILSSKDEGENLEFATPHKNLKNKRFLFFRNEDAYVASTTVTSLNIVSTTTTVTANPSANGALLCLPNGYRVC